MSASAGGARRSVRRSVSLRAAHVIRRSRGTIAEKAFHAIRGGPPRSLLVLPYPPAARDEPRWGHGRPPHARLTELIARRDGDYRRVLEGFSAYAEQLRAVPLEKGDPREPNWRNGMLFGLDGISLYCFVRERRPRLYIEVGSGNSTLFVHRARRDGGLDMRIVSIDPHPRREIDEICDTVVREPFETLEHSLFGELQAGDVVYFDATHRVFMNSATTAFFLDVLPELPPGVLVGIHDVYLPEDYRAEHAMRYWSEQYLLACYLLGEPDWLEVVLPCWYVERHAELGGPAHELLPAGAHAPANPHGLIFWLQTRPRAQ